MKDTIRIGTRNSKLARWQTDYVSDLLRAINSSLSITVVPIKTTGDADTSVPLEKLGATGVFTKEIEKALLDKKIDIAVHSMKDLETDLPKRLTIGAVPVREDFHDALIAKNGESLDDLSEGAKILTGSPRRKAQLLHYRPDLRIEDVRGNVETRIKNLHDSDANALILAVAGLKRLGLSNHISSLIPEEILLPAIGQGTLAVQVRSNDKNIVKLCSKINNTTLAAVTAAERSYLRVLQGGCQVPAGCIGQLSGNKLILTGAVATQDGSKLVRQSFQGDPAEPERVGEQLAKTILDAGGDAILESFRSSSTDAGI